MIVDTSALIAILKADPDAERFAEALEQGRGGRISAANYPETAIARAAYRDFGRESGHPATLNVGDCFAYALAS